MGPLRLRLSTMLIALGALGSTAACSAAPDPKPEEVASDEAALNGNPKVVLAVGNSVTFGFQSALLVPPFTPPTTGSVDLFANRHKKTIPVNFSIPGETSTGLVYGPPGDYASVFPLHNPLTKPTQLATAEDYLANNPGRTHGIIIDVGSNDLLQLVFACGSDDLATFVHCMDDNLPAVVGTIKANLDTIVTRLHAKAPQAEIYVYNIYNIYQLIDPDNTERWVGATNAGIADVAKKHRAKVIDLHALINGGGATTLCSLTNLCGGDDTHPNDAGYAAIADLVCNAAQSFRCDCH